MTTANQIQFTCKLASGTIRTRDAVEYEDYCQRKQNAFEIIPDDAMIKPYFDIDYKLKDEEEFCEKVANYLLVFSLAKLQGYYNENTAVAEKLKFAVATSHKNSKYSFHINLLNVNTTKASLKHLIGEINKFGKETFKMFLSDYIEIGDEDVFDDSVYSKGIQKMRSVYCCKDDEPDRPVRLLSVESFHQFLDELPHDLKSVCGRLKDHVTGEFNDMVITAFVDPNNYFHEVVPAQITKPVKQPKISKCDNTYDEMLISMAIDQGLMTEFSKSFETWRNIGWIIKNTFNEVKGWELFDRFSQLTPASYDPSKNKEMWDSWKAKADVQNPIGMGSLVDMLKKVNKPVLSEIQKEIKAQRKADTQNIIQQEEKDAVETAFKLEAEEFEKTHCKIINSSLYIKELPNKIITMSRSKLEASYEHIAIGQSKKGAPILFINKWMTGNDSIRKYDDMDIYPNVSSCPSNIYNMWRPFAGELFTGEYEKNNEALQMVLKHICILCNNEKAVYEYIINFIAQMIQFPETKTIVPTLISKQGAGKGSLIKLCTKMLGAEKVIETTEPSRDVWGQFNGMMVNSFLVNLNELSKRETMESEGKIKGLITDPTLTINNKGINQFKIKSHHRFIITTNDEEGGMKTTDDDRRNLIIRSSDELIGNKEYFSKLHDYLEDEAVIRTCYDYFKSIPDMDKFGQIPIPQTEYQNECKKLSTSPIDLWLEDLTRSNMDETVVELTGKEAYQYFNQFVMENNIKFNTTPLKLGVKLTNMKIDGVTKGRHTDHGDTKYYNIKALKKRYSIGCLINIEGDTDEEM